MQDGGVVGIVAQLVMMILTGVASWLGGKIRGAAAERKKREEKEEQEKHTSREVQRLLLFYRLKDLYTDYVINAKPITSSDKHEIEEAYTYYHNLGGNGEGTRMYGKMMELKISG